MTYYSSEINRIKKICYRNTAQVKAIIGVKHYIDSNMCHELNLNLLSRNRFISKFHLLRLFKKYYGLSPKQYHIARRLIHARALLSAGRAVSEACYTVGFTSPASFSTLFKNTFGCAPVEFQKKQLLQSPDCAKSGVLRHI